MPTDHGRIVDENADNAERTYALFNHLAGLLSLGNGIPLAGLIATLILWRIKAAESPYLDDHGREAVNFQISLILYGLAGVVLGGLLTALTIGLAAPLVLAAGGVGYVALLVLNIVGTVRGAMAANRGEYYRYPMCLRLIASPAAV